MLHKAPHKVLHKVLPPLMLARIMEATKLQHHKDIHLVDLLQDPAPHPAGLPVLVLRAVRLVAQEETDHRVHLVLLLVAQLVAINKYSHCYL